jgi:hypothetical protein
MSEIFLLLRDMDYDVEEPSNPRDPFPFTKPYTALWQEWMYLYFQL